MRDTTGNPNSAPAVSVVMPVRDAVDTVSAAVQSIRDQTFTDWELVTVDDGSSDRTATLLNEIAEIDSRVRVITRPPEGIAAALNCGIADSRGAYIARMDADDISLPERFAAQVEFLLEFPCYGLVSTQVRFGGDRSSAEGFASYIDWSNAILTPEQIYLNRFVESPVAHPSVMFRREVLKLYGAYTDGAFPEDYELWLRWLKAGVRMAKLKSELVVWNDSPARLSRSDQRYSVDAFYQTKAHYIADWLLARRADCPVYIWGAGKTARRRAKLLRPLGIAPVTYIDIDPNKIGQTMGGVPVIAPDRIPEPGYCFVLSYVGSRGARERIRKNLQSAGHQEGRDFYLAA